jgi:hypothetical protein
MTMVARFILYIQQSPADKTLTLPRDQYHSKKIVPIPVREFEYVMDGNRIYRPPKDSCFPRQCSTFEFPIAALAEILQERAIPRNEREAGF